MSVLVAEPPVVLLEAPPPDEFLLTVDDLACLPDDGYRYEVIEGEIYMACAPDLVHQFISGKAFSAFDRYLENNPIGVIIATPGVIFDEYNGVIPDLVFLLRERIGEIASGKRIEGAPDLIIEIISPGSTNIKRDRVVKRKLYGRFGVKEYWIINGFAREVEIYRPHGRGLRLAAVLRGEDLITTPLLPGFSCRTANLF
jgi:Uma2 family endonuclease